MGFTCRPDQYTMASYPAATTSSYSSGSRLPRGACLPAPVRAYSPAPPATVDLLLPAHLGGHLGIVLLEALSEASLGGHGLLHAAGDAAVLARRDGLGCEVVDAGHEAVVDQAAEELHGGEGQCQSDVWGGGPKGEGLDPLFYVLRQTPSPGASACAARARAARWR